MLFADTMAIFFVIVGLLITFPSIWLLCTALWPESVFQNRIAVQNGLAKSFWIGVPVIALCVFLIAVVGKLPATFGQIGGVLSFALTMLFAQSGVAGLATHIGHRLRSPADSERPWKATLRGGIVLVLSYLLPVVGWFLILPVSIIIGAGSAARTLCGAFRSNNGSKNRHGTMRADLPGTDNSDQELEGTAPTSLYPPAESGMSSVENVLSSGTSSSS